MPIYRAMRGGSGQSRVIKIREVVDGLQHADQTQQQDTAALLEALQESKAVEPVLTLLTNAEDDEQRVQLLCLLAKLNDPRALYPLACLAIDRTTTTYVRSEATRVLREIARERMGILSDAVNDADATVREQAARVLNALKDHNAPLQQQPTRMALRQLRQSSHAIVRSLTTESTTVIGDNMADPPATIDEVAHALDALTIDVEWSARAHTLRTLGRLADARAVAPLVTALADVSDEIRQEAAESLGCLALDDVDVADAVEPLIMMLQSAAWYTRYRAAEALGFIGDRRADEPLIRMLRDESPQVRARAATALGDAMADKAMPALMTALKDVDQQVRVAAARALGMLQQVEAIAVLQDSAQDEEPEVRMAIKRALEMLYDLLPMDEEAPFAEAVTPVVSPVVTVPPTGLAWLGNATVVKTGRMPSFLN